MMTQKINVGVGETFLKQCIVMNMHDLEANIKLSAQSVLFLGIMKTRLTQKNKTYPLRKPND
jgi:hypothetical protein